MNWLGRIFYTVLSMSGMMLFLAPLVLLLRFGMRNQEKKFMKWEWWLVYLRSLCPVALSSPICFFDSWNRQYHLFLSTLGLTIEEQSGIMNSWSAVFLHPVHMTKTFTVCAVTWAAGVFLVLFSAFFVQRRVKQTLMQGKEIGEDILESGTTSVPVRFGFFHKIHVVPAGMHARDMRYYLQHIQAHSFENAKRIVVVGITAIHWFNPVMWLYYILWNHDEEYLADEKAVHKKPSAECREYAQGLLNIQKESKKLHLSLFTIREGNVEKRAQRMMYLKWDKTGEKLLNFLIWSVTLILFFLLAPMKIAWSGGTWQNPVDSSKGSLFSNTKGIVIAKTDISSPDGLDQILKLELLEKDKTDKDSYTGTFALRMYDDFDNRIASLSMKDIFGTGGSYAFPKDMNLFVGDYNGDGTQEAVLGKKLSLSQKEFDRMTEQTDSSQKVKDYTVYSYSVINLEKENMQVIGSDICAAVSKNGKKELSSSVELDTIEDITTVFSVPFAKETQYYVWNQEKGKYEQKDLSKKDLEQYKTDSTAEAKEETQEHTLKNNSGSTAVLVTTKKDSDGNEDIQSLILSPKKNQKKWDNIHGYYCDLKWITQENVLNNRYAMLIYNGTKAQTFTVYDTKTRTQYYQQEDGTTQLAKVFKQYKEDDITFEDGAVVVYNLKELKDDILTIGFAGQADNGITVKGSYQYDIKKKLTTNFTYSREADTDASASASPSPTTK